MVLIAEILACFGQVMFKKGANSLEAYELHKLEGHASFMKDAIAEPKILLGFIAMAISLVVWIFALATADLSIVFSLGSLQYVIVLFAANYFLGEKIDFPKLIGTLLVVAGIALVLASH
jgi:uncharacterized membrane protein